MLNLGLLLGTSIVPWPTALISASVRSGNNSDQAAATLVYAAMTVIVAIPWMALNLHLSRRPDLLESPSSSRWLRRNAALSAFPLVLAAIAAGLALVAPLASLLLFLIAPLFFLVTNFPRSYRSVNIEPGEGEGRLLGSCRRGGSEEKTKQGGARSARRSGATSS